MLFGEQFWKCVRRAAQTVLACHDLWRDEADSILNACDDVNQIVQICLSETDQTTVPKRIDQVNDVFTAAVEEENEFCLGRDGPDFMDKFRRAYVGEVEANKNEIRPIRLSRPEARYARMLAGGYFDPASRLEEMGRQLGSGLTMVDDCPGDGWTIIEGNCW